MIVQQHEVVLRTKQLVKRFGSITAVDGLDVEVRRGEVVGLLGPNGAGKSTTIGMVLGLITPTAGTAEVLGRDIRVRREDAFAGGDERARCLGQIRHAALRIAMS